MNDHLKQFANHSAYQAVEDNLDLPNVSLCVQENEVHYNKEIDPNYLTLIYDVNTTVDDTYLLNNGYWSSLYCHLEEYFEEMKIDGVLQPELKYYYQFNTEGKHIAEYKPMSESNCDLDLSFCTGTLRLKKVIIPSQITTIWDESFKNCALLSSIKILNTTAVIGTSYNTSVDFSGTASNLKIYVPNQLLNAYKADPRWSAYSDIIYPY